MYIELNNIRCYKRKTFDFPDDSLILLSGESGAGKTSILKGINFALYGKEKVMSWGEKKCMVKLMFQEMEIIRSKGPNRLLVNVNGEEYEGDVAQEIINKKYGTDFTITSYIIQKGSNSFFSLTPKQKMEFLERIVLDEDNISQIKIDIKNAIKESKELLIQKASQLQFITEQVSRMEKPKEIEFPLGKYSDKKVKNEAIRWKKTSKELKQLIKTEQNIKENYANEKIEIALMNKQRKIEGELELKISNINKEKKGIDFEGDDNLELLKEAFEYLRVERTYEQMHTRYLEQRKTFEQLQAQEITAMEKELSELIDKKEELNYSSDKEDKIKSLESQLEQYKKKEAVQRELSKKQEKLHGYTDLNELKQELEGLNSSNEKLEELSIDIEQRIEIKCCPNCKVSLRFQKNSLVKASGEPVTEETKEELAKNKKQLQKNKKRIEEIKAQIVLIKDINQTIEKLIEESKEIALEEDFDAKNARRLLDEIKEIGKQSRELKEQIVVLKGKIKSKTFSQTLKKMEVDLNCKKNELERLKKQMNDPVETEYTEDELRHEITEQVLFKEKVKNLETQEKNLINELDECRADILKINISNRDFEKELEEAYEQLVILKEKNEEHEKNNTLIQEYLEYKKKLEEYDIWQSKIDKLKEEELKAKRKLTVAETLSKKVSEAETLAVMQTIALINYHTNNYLEKFFPDNNITVEICPYKETKKDIKPQINITVGYKGTDVDLDDISGGEYDRVTLSIVLALNSIFSSDLLILDESIASLNNDLANDILMDLKDIVKNKLVIVVAHQIVEGVFDTIVECH